MSAVWVEEVVRGKVRMRFVELPQFLHGADPRFAPLVLAWERYRLDPHRNPALEEAEAELFLARRAGRPAGRVATYLAPGGGDEGRFGFWCCVDDPEVSAALLDAARAWLGERGCSSMVGPLSFSEADEPGALCDGFDSPGTTGRPWRPPWEAELLESAGGEVVAETSTWEIEAADLGVEAGTAGPSPEQGGPHGDPRLVLGQIAAVPDVSAALRSTGLRGAWRLVRRVRAGDWDRCTVVRCEGDPSYLVPAVVTAAARAGYRWVVAPWSPDPEADPQTRHRTYRLRC